MNVTQPIYHLVGAAEYQAQPPDQPYAPGSLRQEGFIHCTAEKSLLIEVANAFFADPGVELLVLVIDPQRLTARLVFEPPASPVYASEQTSFNPPPQTLFPHLYGPLNREAVLDIFALAREINGHWCWPPGKD